MPFGEKTFRISSSVMRLLRVSVVVLIVIVCPRGIMAGTERSSESQTDRARLEQDAVMCGPNCLYLYLKLYGIPVQYKQLKQQFTPASPEGMSLAELRDACTYFGLPMEVRQCTIPQMHKAFRRPVIAYVNGITRDIGHYTIILGVHSDAAYLMDGTTGRIHKTTLYRDETYKKGRLENVWRGYILVPTVRPRGLARAFGFSVLAYVIAGAIILRIRSRSRTTRAIS